MKPKGRGAGVGTKRKGGGGRPQHKPNKKGPGALRDVPLPEEEAGAGGSDVEISDEDMEFVKQHTSSLSFLKHLDAKALDKSVKAAQKRDVSKQLGKEADADDDAEPDAPGQSKGATRAGGRGYKPEDEDGDEEGVEDYERTPRLHRQADGPKSRGLPVKTLEGSVQYEADGDGAGPRSKGLHALTRASQAPQVEGIIVEDELEVALKKRDREAAEKAEQHAEEAARKKAAQERVAAEKAVPAALVALQDLRDREQRVSRAREAMAVAASKLLTGPEEAVAEFKVLMGLLTDKEQQVSRLAMVSLLAVFTDIAPGYKIRPPTEKELQVKVSKDVQRLRDYEAALLRHYQVYLKSLLNAAKIDEGAGRKGKGSQAAKPSRAANHSVAHARVAVKCMAQLLSTLPHFNYASDLLQAVVPHMASNDVQIRSMACGAVHSLLCSGETHGKLALEAVQLVADLIRVKNCVCPPEVVQVLSVMSFTEVKRQEDHKDDKKKKHKDAKGKKAGGKRARTELDAEVDRDFKESEAVTDRRVLAIQQSQMLEALFEVYFRVLKTCTSSPLITRDPTAPPAPPANKPNNTPKQPASAAPPVNGKARQGATGGGAAVEVVGPVAPGLGASRARVLSKHPLLYPALEGLGRHAHLISVEYFNDILEVFHQLLRSPGLPLVDRLRVLLTASNILRGQGEALVIDRRELFNQLYASLLAVPIKGLADIPSQGPPAKPGQPGVKGSAAAAQQGDEEDSDLSDHPGTAALAAAAAHNGLLVGSGGGQQGEASRSPLSQLDPSVEAYISQRVEEPVAMLLAGVLGQMLCEPKVLDMNRLAAFVKRCMSMSSQAPTPEAITMLGCCMRLLRRYPRLQALLTWEGEAPVGGRSWLPDCPDPSEAGAPSSCLWELSLLSLHYHPHIAQSAKSILDLSTPGRAQDAAKAQLSGPLALPGTLRDLAAHYASLGTGSYRPAPPTPSARKSGGPPAKRLLRQVASDEFEALLQQHATQLSGSCLVAGRDDTEETDEEREEEDEEEEDVELAGDEESRVALGLEQHYKAARRFQLNQELREEKGKLVAQIQAFQVHLHQKQQSAQQRQKPGLKVQVEQKQAQGSKRHKRG